MQSARMALRRLEGAQRWSTAIHAWIRFDDREIVAITDTQGRHWVYHWMRNDGTDEICEQGTLEENGAAFLQMAVHGNIR